MLLKDIENYFYEISSVLKIHGKCLITYFLLNKESLKFINKKLSSIDFKYEFENSFIKDKDSPEKTVVYDENMIQNLYKKYKMKIIEPIHYGSWSGRKNYLSYQDIVIAVKSF